MICQWRKNNLLRQEIEFLIHMVTKDIMKLNIKKYKNNPRMDAALNSKRA